MVPALFFSAGVVLNINWLYSRKRKKADTYNKISQTLFIAYVLVILQTAFLSREPGSRKGVSLVLFETWGRSFHAHALFIENIIMFIPFGILVPMLFKRFRYGWKCVLLGFLCSCGIEITQHITQRGYMQSDDVVTNTVGTLVGWSIWKVGIQLRIKLDKRYSGSAIYEKEVTHLEMKR